MESWQIKKAYQEQHYDRLLQEAVKSRLLSKAKEQGNSFAREKDSRLIVRRRLVYVTVILVALVLLTVMTVLAAGIAGGGSGLNLMV